MKLPYATKYNGNYYLANEEIPVENKAEKPEIKKPEVEVDVKVDKRKTTNKK